MKLQTYLKRFSTPEARAAFAFRVGTTWPHLSNVAYGTSTASAALTRQVAIHTEGEVREWELRPDDWHRIWPELESAPGAPAAPAPPAPRASRRAPAAAAAGN